MTLLESLMITELMTGAIALLLTISALMRFVLSYLVWPHETAIRLGVAVAHAYLAFTSWMLVSGQGIGLPDEPAAMLLFCGALLIAAFMCVVDAVDALVGVVSRRARLAGQMKCALEASDRRT